MNSVSKICLTPLVLSALINICSNNALADEDFYAGMRGGISKTQAVQNNSLPILSTLSPLSSNQTTALHFKIGSNAGLQLGYEQKNTRTELETLTFYSGYKNLRTNQIPIDFASGRTRASAAFLNVYYDVKQNPTVFPTIFPFAGAGVGIARIKNRLFLPSAMATRLDKKFAWQGMAGFMFNVIPKASFTMDYRYLGTQRLKAFHKPLNHQSFNLGFLGRF